MCHRPPRRAHINGNRKGRPAQHGPRPLCRPSPPLAFSGRPVPRALQPPTLALGYRTRMSRAHTQLLSSEKLLAAVWTCGGREASGHGRSLTLPAPAPARNCQACSAPRGQPHVPDVSCGTCRQSTGG
ncbi:hypothetical protein BC628DRAFT_828976 [Trametes gibbosa]|nr:hypothetical protein BC628DRAFT_828976 [Trametes gibbosa]